MKYENVSNDSHQKDPQLSDQKSMFIDILISQLKTLFSILICTILLVQLFRAGFVYHDIFNFSFFILLVLCDVCLMILFVIDMKRLINYGLILYKITHHSKSPRNSA